MIQNFANISKYKNFTPMRTPAPFLCRARGKRRVLVLMVRRRNANKKGRPKRSPLNTLRVTFYLRREYATVKPAMTMETMLINLMRMFRLGPEVSLNGSPTVSPMTVAL